MSDSIKFNEKFIIKLTNESNNIIDRNAKQTCKILQIPSELNIDLKLSIISKLEPSEYPNLFMFIIEHQNGAFLTENQGTKVQQLDEYLKKFKATRPLIIQQICEAENKSKFYYKGEGSSQMVDIDQHYAENCELYEKCRDNLSTILDQQLEQFEDELLKKLSHIQDSSIVLRFLRTLNIQEEFFGTIVLEIAKSGSKTDLLAIFDASFEDNGRILNDQAQNYIKNVFEDDESRSESANAIDDEQVDSDLDDQPDDQDDPIDEKSLKINIEDSSQSVFLTAVQNSNKEIIDFLITYWTPLIQELPVKHQIRISTAAYDKNQLDVLCDLLEISDFPFPKGFNVTNDQFINERLQKIIIGRIKFHEVIKQENYNEIKDFIENNLSLKFIYSPQNVTAMKEAIDSKMFKVYYYLKSFGLSASEFDRLHEILNDEDLEKAQKYAIIQRNEIVDDALCAERSVMVLCMKSLIHNRKIKGNQEAGYRINIKKWIEDIHKVAPELLDVAASCKNLKIIFDFESMMVDRTAFYDNALGLAYSTVSSRIFIGAKLGDSKREQEIKGVIAHELCHYVMSFVYDNKFLPYYKHALDIRYKFDGIVESVDKWSSNNPELPNDECNGIISSVFMAYPKRCFPYELIVRAVHILVFYDDNPKHSSYLQEKYQLLFGFWNQHVLHDLKSFDINLIETVKIINDDNNLLHSISKKGFGLIDCENDVLQSILNGITIVKTNIPSMFFIHIYKCLKNKHKNRLNSQNLFIEPTKLYQRRIREEFQEVCSEKKELNIFIDCTNGAPNVVENIFINNKLCFVFVVKSDSQREQIKRMCLEEGSRTASVVDKDYSWDDLDHKSKGKLLQTSIDFNNNSIQLDKLISCENVDSDGLSEVICEKFLNLLLDGSTISINRNFDLATMNKNFDILFRSRKFKKFVKKIGSDDSDDDDDDANVTSLSNEEVLTTVANDKYVLISDIPGTGKSWIMQNFAKVYRKSYPEKWVICVELLKHTIPFRNLQNQPDFPSFMIEKILKLKDVIYINIFKNLYKNGKVVIFFDGFDEISNYAEKVKLLIQAFEKNGDNQMWISTRKQFEVNLRNELKLNSTYGFGIFTKDDGKNFIAKSWIIDELGDEIDSSAEIEKIVNESENLVTYQGYAEELIKRYKKLKNPAVGFPAFYEVLSVFFKNNKTPPENAEYYEEISKLQTARGDVKTANP